MRIRFLVPLLCALLVAAAWPAGANAAQKAIFGPAFLPNGQSAFPTYHDLGVKTYQTFVRWNNIAGGNRPSDPRNPNDPAYWWPRDLDRVVAEGQRQGIAIAPVVIGSPRWANGGRDWRWAPTRDSDYTDFLIAMSRRYPGIRLWQIWGEPSRGAAFQPGGLPTAPRRYATLLDASYRTLKALSSRNVVIGGNTFTGGSAANGSVYPVQFLQALRLPSGRPPRLDWWGHNPYSRRYPDGRRETYGRYTRDINDMDVFANEVRSVYGKIGLAPKLWLGEYSIQSDHGSHVFPYYVSRRDQADWVTGAYRLANAQSSIAGLGWMSMIDDRPSTGSCSQHGYERHWGLIDWCGLKKKWAYYAYRRVP